MKSSLETQWADQRARRGRLIRIMLLLIGGLGVLGVLAWFWVTQPLFGQPVAIPSAQVDQARLEAHVRMLSETLSPRDQSQIDNLDRVASYINEEFSKAGGRVSYQPFTVAGRSYRNVLASFGPEADERIVVGAHYDAYHAF